MGEGGSAYGARVLAEGSDGYSIGSTVAQVHHALCPFPLPPLPCCFVSVICTAVVPQESQAVCSELDAFLEAKKAEEEPEVGDLIEPQDALSAQ